MDLFRQVLGSRISKKDMLHGTEEMYNTAAAALKAAAEGWSIDRLSGSTTQVRVYDQGMRICQLTREAPLRRLRL